MKPSIHRPQTNVKPALSSLKFSTRDNLALPRIPASHRVQKRPLTRPAIANKFAGSHVPKIVYVSRRTPVVSAVKRVKRFLREVEKRAVQGADVGKVIKGSSGGGGSSGTGDPGQALRRTLQGISAEIGAAKGEEEVLVKASGAAIEQALRVAEWFRSREKEMLTSVVVRTGKVCAIDDLVEREDGNEGLGRYGEGNVDDEEMDVDGIDMAEGQTSLQGGETTLELLAHLDAAKRAQEQVSLLDKVDGEDSKQVGVVREGEEDRDNDLRASEGATSQAREKTKRVRKRKKKVKEVYDADDMPEARLRWVKTVEIAISLAA